jgi:hypothetical protein
VLVVLAALTLPVYAMAGAQVPFKGSDVGTFTLTAGGVCWEGWFQVDITGSGNATHLGRYTYVARECFNPLSGAFGGTFTLTAANGDEVRGTYDGQVSGTLDPDVAAYHESADITGGTGRFAGASGTLEIDGLANLATGGYSQTLSGDITSPGAAK